MKLALAHFVPFTAFGGVAGAFVQTPLAELFPAMAGSPVPVLAGAAVGGLFGACTYTMHRLTLTPSPLKVHYEALQKSTYQIVHRYEQSERLFVVRALRKSDGKTVVLKMPPPHLSVDVISSRSRAVRWEYDAVTKIDSPYVMKATGFYEGEGYFIEELAYVPGEDLGFAMIHGRRFSADKAKKILTSLAEGLKAIHQAGYAHSDLKLENIILHPDGYVVIIDLERSSASPYLSGMLRDWGRAAGWILAATPELSEKSALGRLIKRTGLENTDYPDFDSFLQDLQQLHFIASSP